jgi:hypothetical protein
LLELPVSNVLAGTRALSRAADLRFRPSLTGGSARDASLDRHVVRLSPTHGFPVAPGIGLASPAGDGRTVDALGCRWTVRHSD